MAMNNKPYEVAVAVLNGSVFIGSDGCQWITSNHEQLLSCWPTQRCSVPTAFSSDSCSDAHARAVQELCGTVVQYCFDDDISHHETIKINSFSTVLKRDKLKN